jgi:sulfatase maturation enzyme AslB (radical SAM superfamily)
MEGTAMTTTKTLSPLNTPWKMRFHSDTMLPLLAGEYESVTPVTVHFSPTLKCRHSCYFCTYGGTKKQNGKLEMTLEEAKHYLDELASVSVRGVIFTGGGDPTQHPDLYAMMEHCDSLGMDYSLNTNGLCLTPELSKKIMGLNPTYVRLSINAGSPEVQELMSGQAGFDTVLANFEALLDNKVELSCPANIVVACVVGIINYLDMENLADRIAEIADRVKGRHGLDTLPVDINIRPIYNYPGSKIHNGQIHDKIAAYLSARSEDDARSYEQFLAGEQTPPRVLEHVVDTIERAIMPKLADTDINVFYPREKMLAVGECHSKPYKRCNGLYLYGFLWPDGRLFPCVEWAGTDGYEIGSLAAQSAKEIMRSRERMRVIDEINGCIHQKCAPICAYHEMNKYIHSLIEDGETYESREKISLPPEDARKVGVSFI